MQILRDAYCCGMVFFYTKSLAKRKGREKKKKRNSFSYSLLFSSQKNPNPQKTPTTKKPQTTILNKTKKTPPKSNNTTKPLSNAIFASPCFLYTLGSRVYGVDNGAILVTVSNRVKTLVVTLLMCQTIQ